MAEAARPAKCRAAASRRGTPDGDDDMIKLFVLSFPTLALSQRAGAAYFLPVKLQGDALADTTPISPLFPFWEEVSEGVGRNKAS